MGACCEGSKNVPVKGQRPISGRAPSNLKKSTPKKGNNAFQTPQKTPAKDANPEKTPSANASAKQAHQKQKDV